MKWLLAVLVGIVVGFALWKRRPRPEPEPMFINWRGYWRDLERVDSV